MATKEQVLEQTKVEAKKALDELKSSLGDLYEQRKEKLAYFVEELTFCKVSIALGIKDEKIKEDLENLMIGLQSEINTMTYKTNEEGTKIFKELFVTATKILISSALSSVA